MSDPTTGPLYVVLGGAAAAALAAFWQCAERALCEDADECSSSCSRRSEAERPSRGGERPPTGCGAYGMGEQHGPGPSPA